MNRLFVILAVLLIGTFGAVIGVLLAFFPNSYHRLMGAWHGVPPGESEHATSAERRVAGAMVAGVCLYAVVQMIRALIGAGR